ncbi:MAG: hypothetical protein JWM74_2216 [Myxococcaceae bacterium]|nr:hypothetical protein [Myxococcaceae bacterium]
MTRALAIALVFATASCANRRSPADESGFREERHTCDPSGPSSPPRTPSFTEHVTAELYPDELDLVETCAVHVTADDAGEPRLLDDDALKAACAVAARKAPKGKTVACRRACVVSARVETATALYNVIAKQLGLIEARAKLPEKAACWRGSEAIVRGEPARALWACLGLIPLPMRMNVEIAFAPPAKRVPGAEAAPVLDHARVDGPLLPGGKPYAFRWAETDQGCGLSAYAVEVLP